MIKFKKVLFLGILGLSVSAWANTAEVLLKNDLQKAVKSLPRDTYFYHYFNLDTGAYKIEDTTLKDLSGRQVYVDGRLALGGKVFRDFERRTTAFSNAGPGLYLAADPYASSPAASKDSGGFFGDSMVEIKMRAGANYISVFNSVAVSPQTVQALISEGYLTTESANKLLPGKRFSRDTFKFMVGYGVENFRKLVANLMVDMNVNFIEYAWQSGVKALCDWKDIRSAFVYIADGRSADIIDANLVYWKGFSDKVVLSQGEADSLSRGKKLHSLLSQLRVLEKKMDATKGASARSSIRQSVNGEIRNEFPQSSEIEEIKSHIFKCE